MTRCISALHKIDSDGALSRTRSRRKRAWRGVVCGGVIAALGIALSACTSQASGSHSTDSASSAAVDKNGTVTMAFTQDPATFDPRLAYNSYSSSVRRAIFDSLVEPDLYSKGKTTAIIPGLATSWTISPDGLTYTFNLRKGVTFTDGTALDADSIVFNMDTLIDPSFQYFCQSCASASAAAIAGIESVTANGEDQVIFKLSAPNGALLDTIANTPQLLVISPAAIKKYGNDGINAHPIGSGYLKLDSYTPGQRVVLSRNDSYWRGPVSYKTLILSITTDGSARANALQSGAVNVALDIDPSYIKSWANASDTRAVVTPSIRQYGCQLNYRGNGPMTNKNFREAMSLAADRDAMNAAVYGGKSEPAKGFFAPNTPAYDPSMPALAFDPAKAKQLLASTPYANGATVTMETGYTNPADAKTVALWQDQLKSIGITLKVKVVDRATWVSDWNKGLDPVPAGADAMCWEYGTSQYWGFARYAGKAGFDNGPVIFNPGRYTDPDVEAALTQASEATDLDSFFKYLSAANKAMMADFGMLYTIDTPSIVGLRSQVQWSPKTTDLYSFYGISVSA